MLTPDEVAYLQKESPGLYEQRISERQEEEAYKKALSCAKTKDEVEHLHMTRLSQFLSEARTVSKDPAIGKDKKLEIMLKIESRLEREEKATTEFKSSAKYENLPDNAIEKAAEEQVERDEKLGNDQVAESAETSDDAKEAKTSERSAEATDETESAEKKTSASEEPVKIKSSKTEKKEKVRKRRKTFIPEKTESAEAVAAQILFLILPYYAKGNRHGENRNRCFVLKLSCKNLLL